MNYPISKIALKKIFSICLFTLCCTPAFSQATNYSCDTREYCSWDTTTMTFMDSQPKDESSLFNLNADKTIFEHTTATIKSTYYVTKHEHDDVNDVEVYEVTSDVGNKYTLVVDAASSEVRVLDTSGDDIYMLRFHIESTWSDD